MLQKLMATGSMEASPFILASFILRKGKKSYATVRAVGV
jgi:hypothetical protein